MVDNNLNDAGKANEDNGHEELADIGLVGFKLQLEIFEKLVVRIRQRGRGRRREEKERKKEREYCTPLSTANTRHILAATKHYQGVELMPEGHLLSELVFDISSQRRTNGPS